MENNERSKRTLSLSQIISYGFGGMFATNPNALYLNYYFLFYLTDISGLGTIIATSIYSITETIKLISMPLSGVLIDGCNLKRFGKYRPWIGICSVITLICSGAIFLNYEIQNPIMRAVLIVIFFSLTIIAYNVRWTGERAMVGPMSGNTQDSISLTGAASAGGAIAGSLYGLVAPALLAAFAASSQQYALTGYIFGAVAFIGGMVMLRISKPYDRPEIVDVAVKENVVKNTSILSMLKTFKGPGTAFFMAVAGNCAQDSFFFALLAYFTTYILKAPEVLGYAATINYMGRVVGSFLTIKLAEKFTKKQLYFWGNIINACFFISLYFFGRTAFLFLFIRALIGVIDPICSDAIIPAMGNDVSDYYEMRNISHAGAFIQAMIGTAIRFGQYVASLAVSACLVLIGYSAGAEMTEPILNAIMGLMVFGSAFGCLFACVVIHFYRIDEKEIDAYREERAKKRQQVQK